jgi:hydrogenase maturation protein HypF
MTEPLAALVRLRIRLRGRVQGVGFRPFVFRTARRLALSGWVLNDNRGVLLEVEGPQPLVDDFVAEVTTTAPVPAHVDGFEVVECTPQNGSGFAIVASEHEGATRATILPELAVCTDCRREIDDANNRRFGYAFTNCTHCGPRFTIIKALPYDRPNTTMSGFVMCSECRNEYDDPLDRRFHAQPNACPTCGPKLRFVNVAFEDVAEPTSAIIAAAERIRAGQIVAVEGLGGFHLVVDATNDAAVSTLRERKHRWEKPLAVMVASLEQALISVELSEVEASLLQGPEGPIVLCRKRENCALARGLAADTPYLGIMLATTPLHHLLMRELGLPIVATSGNLSEEPICIDPKEATRRLAGIADAWLVHDRPIERHMDDSVVHVVDGAPQFLRRARGYAPLPVPVPASDRVVLALGAHQKSTIALALGDQVFVSQHVGDLESYETKQAFERVVLDFIGLYRARPSVIAHDFHPDYASSQFAEQLTAPGGLLAGVSRMPIQHHHAHLAACLADNSHTGPVLGIIWDGTGLGLDGTIWGGEFLWGDAHGFERVASIKPYPLLGGEAAAREPRRSALALLYQTFGAQIFDWDDLFCIASTPKAERPLLKRILEQHTGTRYTSSVGRLFDAVGSLCGLVAEKSFEGRAGMLLETHFSDADAAPYPLSLSETASRANPTIVPRFLLDPSPMVAEIVADVRSARRPEVIASRFHATLIAAVVEVATRVNASTVVLSGGCFQNRRLTALCIRALQARKIVVLVHRQVPTNDGGLSLGQAAVARARFGTG